VPIPRAALRPGSPRKRQEAGIIGNWRGCQSRYAREVSRKNHLNVSANFLASR
jgi:hypothetical protein